MSLTGTIPTRCFGKASTSSPLCLFPDDTEGSLNSKERKQKGSTLFLFVPEQHVSTSLKISPCTFVFYFSRACILEALPVKQAAGSRTETGASAGIPLAEGVGKGLFLPHSQRGKSEEIQRIKPSYDAGIHHGKPRSACHPGLCWAALHRPPKWSSQKA